MTHKISGFVSAQETFRRAANELHGAQVCELVMGYGFLPIEDDGELADHLSDQLESWAVASSMLGSIAFVTTEYFGGVGVQTAITWKNGRRVFGPRATGNDRDLPVEYAERPDGAINQALRIIGVIATSNLDEFDSIGLGIKRSNEAWLQDK